MLINNNYLKSLDWKIYKLHVLYRYRILLQGFKRSILHTICAIYIVHTM